MATFDPEHLLDAVSTIEQAVAQPIDVAVRDVVQHMLDIFACERAWARLLNVSDDAGLFDAVELSRLPDDVPSREGPASAGERGLSDEPGEQLLGDDPYTRELIELAEAGEVVVCGPGHRAIAPDSRWAALGVRAALLGVFTPRQGPRIVLGLQWRRDTTLELEPRLFGLIGTRLADALALAVALAQLHWSETQSRVLFEHGDALVIVDVGTQRIVDVNHKAEQLFGCPSGYLLGNELAQLCLEPSEQFAVRLAAVVVGEPQVDRWSLRRGEGRPLVCEVDMVAIPSPDRLLVCARLRAPTRTA